MKTILFALSLALLILASAAGIAAGAAWMIYDLYTGGNNFLNGFYVFSLSSILFLVSISAFMLTKVLASTEILADTMTKFLVNEMSKEIKEQNFNPFQALFGGMGLPGQGTIRMTKIEDDGTVSPIGEKNFNTPEEFIKYRNEILNEAFGKTPGKKRIEDMSVEELKAEEAKAIENQDFELAAAVRDLIKERTGKS